MKDRSQRQPQLNVLVVEQDPDLRGALSRTLEERGYEVHTVASRADAFDALDALCPDLLILDDPGQERAYRLVWLKEEDQPDLRVALVDLAPDGLPQQLAGLLGGGRTVA